MCPEEAVARARKGRLATGCKTPSSRLKDRVICDYKDSQALFELVDGNMQKLTNCRRTNKEFFELTDPDNISSLKKEDFYNQPQFRNICFTNEMRKQINKQCMEDFILYQANQLARKTHAKKKNLTEKEIETYIKKLKIVELKAMCNNGNSQDVKLVEGTPIISTKTIRSMKKSKKNEDDDEIDYLINPIEEQKQSIFNNEQFVITSIKVSDKLIIASNSRTEIEIPFHMFQQLFNVAFATTTHKAQGATYNFNYSIWEWDKMDARLKYVALTRATSKKLINII